MTAALRYLLGVKKNKHPPLLSSPILFLSGIDIPIDCSSKVQRSSSVTGCREDIEEHERALGQSRPAGHDGENLCESLVVMDLSAVGYHLCRSSESDLRVPCLFCHS